MTEEQILKRRESRRLYKLRNKDKVREEQRRYYEKHKEERLLYQSQYRETEAGRTAKLNYKHRRRQQESYNDGTVTQESLDELLESQSCTCPMCSVDISERNARHLDHIIPLSKGGLHTISNLQWLCPKCNMSKSNKLP